MARDLLARVEAGTATVDQFRAHMLTHMAFEEAHVVPLLAQHLPTDTGPVRTLLEDHAVLRGLLVDLASAGNRSANVPDRLRALLQAHFEKEEELILPFAHEHFCAEDFERIGCDPEAASVPPTEGES